jgi:hypothetical protein
MAAAQILGLNKDHARVAREACTETRAGDSAADNQDIAIR